jgi:hypothetical protein
MTIVPYQVDDLRDLPLIERKQRLAKLIGKAKRRAIRYSAHLTGDGPTVSEHVCRMGLEGIVSKRTDAPAGHRRCGSSRRTRRARRYSAGGVVLSKVQSVDQRMRLECGVGFRQLRRCRRTRPGQLCAASRLHAPQQMTSLFDQLVGARQQRRWHLEAE